MARKIRTKTVVRNLTNGPQTLNAYDGDTLLFHPHMTQPVNEKFLWQKFDPAVFKILKPKEVAAHQERKFLPGIRDHYARVQSAARVRAKPLPPTLKSRANLPLLPSITTRPWLKK
jgi:hypothetical protein